MKLSQWAKKEGIHYQTAYRWFCSGKLPIESYQTPSGTIIVKNSSEAITSFCCRLYEMRKDTTNH